MARTRLPLRGTLPLRYLDPRRGLIVTANTSTWELEARMPKVLRRPGLPRKASWWTGQGTVTVHLGDDGF